MILAPSTAFLTIKELLFVGKSNWAKGVSAYAKLYPKGGMLMKHPDHPVFQVIRR